MSEAKAGTPERGSAAPVRLAIAGCGAIAQLAHLPALEKMRGVELVAVCDNDRAKARAIAERFGIGAHYQDLEELLDSESLDAVIVATPNHLHEPHVLSVLRAGVDVLVERPLSFTARGTEKVLAAAEKAKRRVFVGNNHRFRTDVQALAQFVQAGELGKLTGIRAGAYAPRPPAGWRQRRPEAGGGAFLEQGFNLLDLALWLADFPEGVRVSATMQRGRGANAVEDGMLVGLELDGDVSVGFDVSWAYVGPHERSWFEVLGTKGSARLAPLRVTKELNGRAVDVSPSGAAARESAFLQSYRAELAHFVAVLRGQTPYEAPTDQVQVARVLEAIYRSAEERKDVRL